MTPYYADPLVTLLHGDCLEVMPGLDAESVDAVVTDPPYDLLSASRNGSRRINNPDNPAGRTGRGFMGKTWDGTGVAFRPDVWRECWRVARPGAYLVAFGGTRTVHRMAVAIEDAGWIIRDQLVWIYASGFPKGRANLKPAHEPIVLARKPGPLRPLAIDECRIEWESPEKAAERPAYGEKYAGRKYGPESDWPKIQGTQSAAGRWPSNILLSDPELFDEPNPEVVGSGATVTSGDKAFSRRGSERHWEGGTFGDDPTAYPGDSGGYSRFFLIPKADRAERERGLAGDPVHVSKRTRGDDREWDIPGSRSGKRLNHHPTVKPIDLMRHLVRLVTPVGGVVLDPFAGSGSTALAASEEGFRCILIEREEEYCEIAKGRILATAMGMGLDVPAPVRKRAKVGTDDPGAVGRRGRKPHNVPGWGFKSGTPPVDVDEGAA